MVPNIISTKDLAYLEDIYEWNFNATKHLNCDLEKIVDEKIKNIYNEALTIHKSICDEVIKILGGKHE